MPRPWHLLAMIDRYFGIAAAGSNIPRELRAGLTTFLTMSYVLLVNPAVLGNAIVIPDGFAKLLVVTALARPRGSLLMGLVARYPFAQAPGMGLNAYFAFTVVLGQKIPWQTALGAVAISGCIFVALSVLGVRQAIVRAIPNHLKFSITAGIGMFLAFIGLKERGGRRPEPGDVRDARLVRVGAGVLIAICGLIFTAVLLRAPRAGRDLARHRRLDAGGDRDARAGLRRAERHPGAVRRLHPRPRRTAGQRRPD